eukprot:TRINITY_DN39265_c0_g1_i1.p1 TRINITY_DN39265_c0_g1~~TRINITY_DN39265_c0_g1_i1.p1  ORF type:complete len:677 (-),score=33.09 TRINITY_DN39265_c0_g1_i1:156-1883(-)
MRRILMNASGSVQRGRFLAIIGGSGAGKSTLLNCLSNRAPPTLGTVYYNSTPLGEIPSLNQRLAYVMQEDIVMKTLTCKEALTFSAMLRLRNMTPAEKRQRVRDTLAELGLTRVADSKVAALSGGEKKRLCIGIEIIHDPPLLMLDEPTSGLDSFTAESVVTSLRHLAENGRTVIATIHQPSSEIFAMFDQVLVLARGQVVYFGNSSNVVPYLSSVGYECPQYSNPADFFLHVLRVEVGQTEVSLKKDDMALAKQFRGYFEQYEKEHPIQTQQMADRSSRSDLVKVGYATGPFTQFGLLTERAFRNVSREPTLSWVRLMQTLVQALLCGLVYLRLDNTQSGVRSKLGAIFFILMAQTFGPMFGVLNTFQEEKALLWREKAGGAYRLTTYFTSKVCSELPWQALFPSLFMSIAYWMCGFNPDPDRFFLAVGAIILHSAATQGLGLLLSVIAPSITVALGISPLFLLPFVLFSGFLTTTGSIPVYFEWLNTISFMRLTLELLAVNEFKGETFECPTAPAPCPTPTWQVLFDANKFNQDAIIPNLGGLLTYVVGSRLLAFIILFYQAWKKERAGLKRE